MAEARLAVGFQLQVTEEGIHLHFDSDAFKFVLRAMARTAKRRAKDIKHAILKRSFPATPASWFVLVAALSAARYSEHQATLGVLRKLEGGIPGAHNLNQSAVIALAVLFVATVLWLLIGNILQFTLRQLLKYRKFLYEPRGKISFKTKCWWTLVKLLGGRNPSLFSYENSMPYLPVPDLDQTVRKYLESVEHLMDSEKYQRMEKLAKEFKDTVGSRLQRYLVLKSWWSTNYVTDWWEQYVYLRSRAPLMINSNYYGVDSVNHPTKIQSARAANFIQALFYYRKLILKERLEPQFALGIVPVCSFQFSRNFGTTRIPGKEQDQLVTHNNTTHIAVYHKGRFFKLECYFRGYLLKPADLERQIEKILNDQSEPVQGEELLPALTGANRTVWAEAREKYLGHGVNKVSLDVIEKAAFILFLDEEEMDYSEESSDSLDRFAHRTLHGNGHNIWFDKSFCLFAFKNGRGDDFIVCWDSYRYDEKGGTTGSLPAPASQKYPENGVATQVAAIVATALRDKLQRKLRRIGFNCEHSWADAPICSHMAECIVTDDVNYLGYKEDGHCRGEPLFEKLPSPARLQWHIPAQCVEIMEESQRKSEELISDLDVHVKVFSKFGKGFIKKCKVSPDAFIQMALQLTYYKDQKRVDLTYESSMTRLFREGRTETVRACTKESTIFVKAMTDPRKTKKDKKEVFLKAVDRHVLGFRQAMEGKGIDRHLFCLYVVSKYLEVDSPFLNEALSASWRLSTSQTPTNQTKRLDLSKNPELTTAGGGFGPVADDGYGISYIISGENLLFFHVTCKERAQNTNAKRFGNTIAESLEEIRDLFVED